MVDYHIHSNFSSDSIMSMEEACIQATKLELEEIAITDHLDYDYPDQDYIFMIDFKKYFEKLKKMEEIFSPILKIIKGLEVGMQPHVAEKNRIHIQNHPYDFIIASIHAVNKLDLHNGDFYKGKTKDQAYTEFLEATYLNITKFDDFDVLGHIDIVKRYNNYKEGNDLHYPDYSDLLDMILKILIDKNKGIEINTSGFRYALNSPMPSLQILMRYKELGGEIITIGSDAHRIEHISYKFETSLELLRNIGFKYIALFKNRKIHYKRI